MSGQVKKFWCKECKEEKDIEEFKMKVGFRKVCLTCYKKKLKSIRSKRTDYPNNRGYRKVVKNEE
jgi:hypothetical protein